MCNAITVVVDLWDYIIFFLGQYIIYYYNNITIQYVTTIHNSNNTILYIIVILLLLRCAFSWYFRFSVYTQTSSSLFSIHCFFLIKIYYVFNANQHILLLRACVYTAGSFVRDQPTVSRSDTYAHRPPRARARTTSVKEKDACNY